MTGVQTCALPISDLQVRCIEPMVYAQSRAWTKEDAVCIFTHSHDLDFLLVKHFLSPPMGPPASLTTIGTTPAIPTIAETNHPVVVIPRTDPLAHFPRLLSSHTLMFRWAILCQVSHRHVLELQLLLAVVLTVIIVISLVEHFVFV